MTKRTTSILGETFNPWITREFAKTSAVCELHVHVRLHRVLRETIFWTTLHPSLCFCDYSSVISPVASCDRDLFHFSGVTRSSARRAHGAGPKQKKKKKHSDECVAYSSRIQRRLRESAQRAEKQRQEDGTETGHHSGDPAESISPKSHAEHIGTGI